MSDGLNPLREARVAELLSDFRTLQYLIAAVPTSPSNPDDYYTEGWAALRQCALDGQHILNCAADISIPCASGPGPDEQAKAELKQVLLDAYARRHEGQKIYLRQAAAQRWVGWRESVMGGGGGGCGGGGMEGVDGQLRAELANITDEAIYAELQANDIRIGRWVDEDPSLREVQRWIRSRSQC
ncbi:hypothetical protein NEUTE1DRAFT_134237 [Neurospora tetrasperma FGSC 2508]|uniref:Uncharacterized protein n=1 Tax=Neurospora tetrasperma (strain FGSC 2508 / ATCC MYA-4615 / P0657) TaxID=510951 RepID=F8MAW2_NEUT8|nr:uncharacterized protein NEUTE1DRAFT_134237 [Neurospora tetrasperma FGSC 2508]EGO60180.1 hypothetical protein NEUTE1DRAFT_134237 [Neurospora tetrasperma FGSC 2508]EGZ69871.1 hypothetical protein NEUTE2DRAFT_170484 [Neurospora tetrasperma FGSC 2509]